MGEKVGAETASETAAAVRGATLAPIIFRRVPADAPSARVSGRALAARKGSGRLENRLRAAAYCPVNMAPDEYSTAVFSVNQSDFLLVKCSCTNLFIVLSLSSKYACPAGRAPAGCQRSPFGCRTATGAHSNDLSR